MPEKIYLLVFPWFKRALDQTLRISAIVLIGLLLLAGSNPSPGDPLEQIRYYTRPLEFDFAGWTLRAFGVKLEQAVLDTERYIAPSERVQIMLSYLDLLRQIRALEWQLELLYANPDVQEPEMVAQPIRQQIVSLEVERNRLEPVAEAILQRQMNEVIADAGLSLGGQVFPPILYRTTSPPLALIISPRQTIRQDFNISILPTLTIEEQITLEDQVDRTFGVSSLVVGIGGMGLYPTMVMETTDINWLAEVVAHEWIHNFLTFRPLGLNYFSSPEMRTMNETVASIGGKELGRMVVERYYPEYLPPPESPLEGNLSPPDAFGRFNFRAEMRQTRVWVDRLLAEGRVEEAEIYMEIRRRFFWENGYQIRKLNQAYFAFYGAYADDPQGGAAGEDPVGAAVRLLRQKSPSLGAFINRISWMASFEQLEAALLRAH